MTKSTLSFIPPPRLQSHDPFIDLTCYFALLQQRELLMHQHHSAWAHVYYPQSEFKPITAGPSAAAICG